MGGGLRTCVSLFLLHLDVGLCKIQRPSMGLDSSGVPWNIWEEWGHISHSHLPLILFQYAEWCFLGRHELRHLFSLDKWLIKETVAPVADLATPWVDGTYLQFMGWLMYLCPPQTGWCLMEAVGLGFPATHKWVHGKVSSLKSCMLPLLSQGGPHESCKFH